MAPQGLRGWSLTAALLRRGAAPRVALEAFENDGHRYPAGTLIMARRPALGAIYEELREMARAAGVTLERVSSSSTESGISLGSESAQGVRLPRIALVGGVPDDRSSFVSH